MEVCPHCRVGRYKKSAIPFLQDVEGTPMLLPNMPAFVCDVCGDIEYDPDMMMNLQYLIHQHEVNNKQLPKIKNTPTPQKPPAPARI